MFPIFQHIIDAQLLGYAVASLVAIVVLIGYFNLNSILALSLAALAMGLAAGMPPAAAVKSFEDGLGKMLGGVSGVIGLGAMLGAMLGKSGGAEVVAGRIVRAFGPKRADWAILAAAIAIGIPVFFSVGFMLLLPIVLAISRKNKIPLMALGIPLAAGLSSMHAFVPPHPGPVAVIGQLKQMLIQKGGTGDELDFGKTILYSLAVSIPAALISGPVFGKWILKRMSFDAPTSAAAEEIAPANPPGLWLTLLTMFMPILLTLLAMAVPLLLTRLKTPPSMQSAIFPWFEFFGKPVVAMLFAVLFSFWSFGLARGMTSREVLKHSNDCLAPVAATLLVVGAGGAFSQVLMDCGVSGAIVRLADRVQLPLLLLGWGVAAIIRVAVGSSTAAITAAVGIVGPMAVGKPGVSLELLTIAMGAGSLFFSHVNDGGFWIVKEFFGISVAQTFKSWSVGTVIGSVAGLIFALILQALI